jgi:DHA2 family multidrug resistance protein
VTPGEPGLSPGRKWAITFSVMTVTFTQVLDTSVTNVALPHMQGSLSAGVEEIAWVLTSYLAANAIVIPASGWLTAYFGRTRFFLISVVLFTLASVLSGMAPTLEFLVGARVLQGLGGGPMIPMSQAIMWEIFPLRQRGTAMAVWGVGLMLAPILGPTLGGYIADNWSWRWIFYVNLPIGLLGFFLGSAFLVDAPHLKRPTRIDVPGIVLMVLGFGLFQYVLDRGERLEWFDSLWIVGCAVVAVVALAGFLARQLTTDHPILDFSVFGDRNFAMGATFIGFSMFGLYGSMLLLALYTQKVLGWDAWTAGTVLAPAGLGNMISLALAGRLVAHMDQRILLAGGLTLNAIAMYWMSQLTLGIDHWSLTWPRLLQGFGQGFVFVPLTTIAFATTPKPLLPNATAAYNVVRNFGGSIGVALATTLLARRSQHHQATLVGHVDVWDPETAARLRDFAQHLLAQGADRFTAERRALAMLYRDATTQAQVLAYADEFWALTIIFTLLLLAIPLLRRVHAEPLATAAVPEARRGAAPAPAE